MNSNIFAVDVEQLKREMEQMNTKSTAPGRHTTNNSNSNATNSNGDNINHQKSKSQINRDDDEVKKSRSENRKSSTGESLSDNHAQSDTKQTCMKKDDENNDEDTMTIGSNVPALNDEDLLKQKQENLRRQELVRHSLDQKSQQLQQEQIRLAKVNSELEAIEHELAKDVEKLREMIDQLSRDIVIWEEDYNFKKKAYLDSEKQLTTAKERRENLTKHLHAIIISNESRKANKLQQLMSALEVSKDNASAQ